MQINFGNPVLFDGQVVGTFRTNRGGGIEVLAIDNFHEVTVLGTVTTESHATGMLRKHAARRAAAEEGSWGSKVATEG